MAFSIRTLFGIKATHKESGFDRRRSDRRQMKDRRDAVRFDSDYDDRRSGRDRRRGHGVWNHRDQ